MKWIALAFVLVVTPIFSQNRVFPYLGMHVSGNSTMLYLGPSYQAGVDVKVLGPLSVGAYVHHFPKHINYYRSDFDFMNAKYRNTTFALAGQIMLSENHDKGFFIGGGYTCQLLKEDMRSDFLNFNRERKIYVPAYKAGYKFQVKNIRASAECNATGPHTIYSLTDSTGYVYASLKEILTQLSVGVRVFIH